MKKWIICLFVLGMMATTVFADPMRPLFTKENRFVAKEALEVGVSYEYTEYEYDAVSMINEEGLMDWSEQATMESTVITPQARYGLLNDVALVGRFPVGASDRNPGDSEIGLGDISVGAEALVFEDIFDYPYVIPHVDYYLGTADEDDGLGLGENRLVAGLSVGTVVNDVFHFITDASFEVRSDTDNAASVALTLMWDVSSELTAVSEVKWTDEEVGVNDEHPAYFRSGLVYEPQDNLLIGVYGGGARKAAEDVYMQARIAYSF